MTEMTDIQKPNFISLIYVVVFVSAYIRSKP